MARSRGRKLPAGEVATLGEIRRLLDPLDEAPTECDGQMRILHHVLTRMRVEHRVLFGSVGLGEASFSPHMWIELSEYPHAVVDYRARMWLGEHAPHGVFDRRDHPGVRYAGESIVLSPLPELLIRLLAMPVKLPKIVR